MKTNSKIYIAGHRGLVGSALYRNLTNAGFNNIITRTSTELDLRNQSAVESFFLTEKPEYVFLSAAKVGGILANKTFPADFLRDNLQIQTNIIDAAYRYNAKKLLFLGSSCIYPKFAPQPICEDSLLSGSLEPTNEGYAIAKIAGIKMCQAYSQQYGFNAISVMPTNLYGPNDNFDLQSSHVLPALVRRFYEAQQTQQDEVVIWGTGQPYREFLHVDDLADACIFLMKHYNDSEIVNIGTGKDITISALAQLIAELVGYQGKIVFDSSKPDGTPRKVLNVDKLKKLGWESSISLRDGILSTFEWYKENVNKKTKHTVKNILL